MATTLTSTFSASATWAFKNDLTLSVTTDADEVQVSQSFAAGTGDEEVNQHYAVEGTVASGANADIDLAGVLANAFGQTITFTKIKGILIENVGKNVSGEYTPTAGEDLHIDGTVTNAWLAMFYGVSTAKLVLPSGGGFMLTHPLGGFTVTAGTGDILRLKNVGAGTVKYRLILQGLS